MECSSIFQSHYSLIARLCSKLNPILHTLAAFLLQSDHVLLAVGPGEDLQTAEMYATFSLRCHWPLLLGLNIATLAPHNNQDVPDDPRCGHRELRRPATASTKPEHPLQKYRGGGTTAHKCIQPLAEVEGTYDELLHLRTCLMPRQSYAQYRRWLSVPSKYQQALSAEKLFSVCNTNRTNAPWHHHQCSNECARYALQACSGQDGDHCRGRPRSVEHFLPA